MNTVLQATPGSHFSQAFFPERYSTLVAKNHPQGEKTSETQPTSLTEGGAKSRQTYIWTRLVFGNNSQFKLIIEENPTKTVCNVSLFVVVRDDNKPPDDTSGLPGSQHFPNISGPNEQCTLLEQFTMKAEDRGKKRQRVPKLTVSVARLPMITLHHYGFRYDVTLDKEAPKISVGSKGVLWGYHKYRLTFKSTNELISLITIMRNYCSDVNDKMISTLYGATQNTLNFPNTPGMRSNTGDFGQSQSAGLDMIYTPFIQTGLNTQSPYTDFGSPIGQMTDPQSAQSQQNRLMPLQNARPQSSSYSQSFQWTPQRPSSSISYQQGDMTHPQFHLPSVADSMSTTPLIGQYGQSIGFTQQEYLPNLAQSQFKSIENPTTIKDYRRGQSQVKTEVTDVVLPRPKSGEASASAIASPHVISDTPKNGKNINLLQAEIPTEGESPFSNGANNSGKSLHRQELQLGQDSDLQESGKHRYKPRKGDEPYVVFGEGDVLLYRLTKREMAISHRLKGLVEGGTGSTPMQTNEPQTEGTQVGTFVPRNKVILSGFGDSATGKIADVPVVCAGHVDEDVAARRAMTAFQRREPRKINMSHLSDAGVEALMAECRRDMQYALALRAIRGMPPLPPRRLYRLLRGGGVCDATTQGNDDDNDKGSSDSSSGNSSGDEDDDDDGQWGTPLDTLQQLVLQRALLARDG